MKAVSPPGPGRRKATGRSVLHSAPSSGGSLVSHTWIASGTISGRLVITAVKVSLPPEITGEELNAINGVPPASTGSAPRDGGATGRNLGGVGVGAGVGVGIGVGSGVGIGVGSAGTGCTGVGVGTASASARATAAATVAGMLGVGMRGGVGAGIVEGVPLGGGFPLEVSIVMGPAAAASSSSVEEPQPSKTTEVNSNNATAHLPPIKIRTTTLKQLRLLLLLRRPLDHPP